MYDRTKTYVDREIEEAIAVLKEYGEWDPSWNQSPEYYIQKAYEF